jgi:hypothetical protein
MLQHEVLLKCHLARERARHIRQVAVAHRELVEFRREHVGVGPHAGSPGSPQAVKFLPAARLPAFHRDL